MSETQQSSQTPLPSLPARPWNWSWRRSTVLLFLLLFVACCYELGLDLIQLSASADPWKVTKDLFGAAFSPTLTDQSPSLPDSAPSFVSRIGKELLTTIRYAFIAMSLAFPMGLLLGFLSSRYCPAHHFIKPITVLMRSIHELIWVMFFLAAIGDSPLAACVALSIPFAGSLAKVFSELLDEHDSSARALLKYSGAGALITFLTSTLPSAWPNLLSYTLYRLECALRSSAVLGFIGYETIGLSILRSSENLYFRELWTELYALIALIILFDVWGAVIRKRLKLPAPDRHSVSPRATVATLKKHRPSWKFLHFSFWTLLLITLCAWSFGEPLIQYHSHIPPSERIATFFQQLAPQPVRENNQWSEALPWAAQLWQTHGKEALLTTLTLATMAILLAAILAISLLPLASRALASHQPLGIPNHRNWFAQFSWSALSFLVRVLIIVSRAIPEYILAFLLVSVMGPHAWPLVFAIAIHNFGILGRLWGEVLENDTSKAPATLRSIGGSRTSIYLSSLIPNIFSKLLLFLTYRWETCVREATVLGMLGISSLGYHIQLAESALHYDVMLFYVLLGTISIYIADVFHAKLRQRLRT